MVDIESLQEIAATIRRRDLNMIHEAGVGHTGGDLSSIDILVALYCGVLNFDASRPSDHGRDRFIMSKGHSSGALYNILAEMGFFPIEELSTYMKPESRLNGHPDTTKVPGVEASTGPLGHGLPIAVGNALAAKLSGASWRTFVLTGDGELQEGSNWEAAMAASHFELDNLTLVIDRNGLQQGDATAATMGLEPLGSRLEAFGWSVAEVDGHDHQQLIDTFRSLPLVDGKPTGVIARTQKGRGVSFMEDRVEWHHRVPNAAELEDALAELKGRRLG